MTMYKDAVQKTGFSLVELSIVLVILGLLTGGILAGQSLIRAAELRGVVADYQRNTVAIHTFRSKYAALPGDFRDATRFWGLAPHGGCVTNSSAGASATGVCDGNNDGKIIGANSPDVNIATEETQAWAHLAAAGLIEGGYTGKTTSDSNYLQPGVNTPPSRLSNSMWRLYSLNNLTGSVTGTHTTTFALNYGNILGIGANVSGTAPLLPDEAWNIDTKMDDGRPAYGNLIARGWQDCTTAASRTELTATYNLSYTTKICSLLFINIK